MRIKSAFAPDEKLNNGVFRSTCEVFSCEASFELCADIIENTRLRHTHDPGSATILFGDMSEPSLEGNATVCT